MPNLMWLPAPSILPWPHSRRAGLSLGAPTAQGLASAAVTEAEPDSRAGVQMLEWLLPSG